MLSRTMLARPLLRVRPAPLASFLKRVLRIHREEFKDSSGRTFWMDPISQFGVCLKGGGYEPILTKWLEETLKSGDLFVDTGAAEGYYSVVAGIISPEVKVVCVEPQPRSLEVLTRNLAANQLQAQVYPLALGATPGTLTFYSHPDTNPGSSGMVQPYRMGGWLRRSDVAASSYPVQVETLDRLFPHFNTKRIRVWKIDCEGFEDPILRGATSILTHQLVDFIVVDFHPQIVGEAKTEETQAFLQRLGYEPHDLPGLRIFRPKHPRTSH